MVGHLFQNYDTFYVQFYCHVYLQSFLLCRFLPSSTCHLSSHAPVYSAPRKHTLNKHAYICAQNDPKYVRYKQTCVCEFILAGRCI